jgi:DNA-binding MarR family transcriptional regulator
VLSEPHPTTGLSEVVHQRVRLGILAVLAEATETSFATVRDTLALTDGNLNRHVQVLREAGLLELRKCQAQSRQRTWLRLTRQGRRELRSEMAALERLVNMLRGR